MGKLSIAQVVCGLMAAAVPATGVQLPNLTGPFPVGTISLELVDYTRVDPLAPSPQPRALMASIFYPTSDDVSQSGNYTFAPAYPPTTALIFDNYIGAPAGTAGSIITQSLLGAPISRPDLPVLIFGHGFSATRLIHTAQLQDLASQGWIVVNVDHTYDAIVVEFPDGRLVPGLSTNSSDYPGGPDGLSEIRAADVAFVASALQNKTVLAQIPGLQRCGGQGGLQTDRIGVFGVSLGGAAAAEAVAKYPTFACGANFDGSIHGNLNKLGFDEPFLIMAAENHNRTNDDTWSAFWDNLRGFRREFKVDGSVHETFTDIPVLLGLLGSAVPADQYGTIAGRRVLEIDTAFMDAFFGYCLKGQPDSQLDGLAGGDFPEVSVGY